MARARPVHRCSDCGATALQWQGRCPGCQAWGTMREEPSTPPRGTAVAAPRLQRIAEVDLSSSAPVPTGLAEVDRVLGGGLVPGSVSLLGGEPGIGKSTLLLQAAAATAARAGPVLYVSAEESATQVRVRAERLGCLPDQLWLLSTTSLADVVRAVDELSPALLVLDSVQTIADPDQPTAPGSPSQVVGCASALVGLAKARGCAAVLVGHVTKDGELAGPRLLEHLVDTVLAFEGDRHHSLRILRAVKHRFGPTGELGLFQMDDEGLAGVADPAGLLLGDRLAGAAGSVAVPTLEGRRPLLVEVQALAVPSKAGFPPRCTGHGLDNSRVGRIVAVLQQRCGLQASGDEVHAAVVGGIRVGEPAADLGIALAIASCKAALPVPADAVAVGEVGLTGEVRQVPGLPRRLAEAARLGFRHALVPASCPDGPAGLRLHRVAHLSAALGAGGLSP